jgi:hypothetical protein
LEKITFLVGLAVVLGSLVVFQSVHQDVERFVVLTNLIKRNQS